MATANEESQRHEGAVHVSESGVGRYSQAIRSGRHHLTADEPQEQGGNDSGPNPYDLLLASLGACTAMTLRMYAERKNLPLKKVRVSLFHEKIHARDCDRCETQDGKLDRIMRVIKLEGELTAAQRDKLLEIADKCPVHRTLTSEIHIVTRVSD